MAKWFSQLCICNRSGLTEINTLGYCLQVQCGKKNLLHCAPSLSPKAELLALKAHVHITTYGPLIDMALCGMLLMRANPLLRQVEGGWALKILTLLGSKWQSPYSLMPVHRAQKSRDFTRAQPPTTCPRIGFARIKSVKYMAV